MVNGGSIVGETGEYGESVTVTGICRICENAKMRKSGEDMGWARFRRRHFRIFAFSHIKMWWCIFRKRRSDAENGMCVLHFGVSGCQKTGYCETKIWRVTGEVRVILYIIYIL